MDKKRAYAITHVPFINIHTYLPESDKRYFVTFDHESNGLM